MFVGFRPRRFVSARPVSAAVLLSVLWCSTAQAADSPEVRGLIATQVHFEGESRERVATAGLELLASCTLRHTASRAEWHTGLRQCHLHFTFVSPRTVTFVPLMKPEKAEVAEMIITFPLWLGRVWVRSGDEYTWFAKWPGQERERLCKPIQELLKEAALDE